MNSVFSLVTLGAFTAFSQVAGATNVLQIDFQNGVDPGVSVPVPVGEPITQDGWDFISVANVPNPTISTLNDTFGGIGITLTAGGGGYFQGRADGAWNMMDGTSWNNMVEDLVAAREGDGNVSISLTGLDDSLEHTLTVWHNVSASNGMSFSDGLYQITPSLAVGTLLGTPTNGQATNWSRDTDPLAEDDDYLNSVISFKSTGGNAEIVLTSARDRGWLPMSGLRVSVPPNDVDLSIRNAPDNKLEFTWNSQSGKVYDLLSSVDPETDGDPSTWPVVAEQEALAATPDTNTLTISRPADDTRLYVIRERNAPPPPPVFFDDFETVPDPDWTTGANGGDTGNTTWQRGAPSSIASNGIPPISGANSSANCFGTNISADYGTDTDIYLRSPVIDLTAEGLTEATLTLQHYLDTELSVNDSGSIRILKAGDLTQLGTNIATELNGIPNAGGTDWNELKVDLPTEALGQMIILEFQFVSDDVEFYSGWYIDDVTVEVK